MRFHRIDLFFVGTLIALGAALAGFAFAQEHDPFSTLSYPIEELGGCESQRACHAYCEDVAHMRACIAFAEEHDLMNDDELAQARRFIEADITEGPGGCRTRAQCSAYCEDINHMVECVQFGERTGLLSGEELAEAKKVAHALSQGVSLPGGCTSKEQCMAYCEDPAHSEECLAFAKAAGFISEEEAAQAESFQDAMLRGETPGGCRSRAECEAYCEREENREECYAFAKDRGHVSKEDEARMQEHLERMQNDFSRAPSDVRRCIESAVGTQFVDQVMRGEAMPTEALGQAMQRCYEEFMAAEEERRMREMPEEEPHDFMMGDAPMHDARMPDFPPEVYRCVAGELGENFEEAMMRGEIDYRRVEEVARRCFMQYEQPLQYDEPPDAYEHDDGSYDEEGEDAYYTDAERDVVDEEQQEIQDSSEEDTSSVTDDAEKSDPEEERDTTEEDTETDAEDDAKQTSLLQRMLAAIISPLQALLGR